MSKKSAKNFVDNVEKKLYLSIKEKTESITLKLEKVLKAFSESHLNVQHFASLTGYGHGDLGRDIIQDTREIWGIITNKEPEDNSATA